VSQKIQTIRLAANVALGNALGLVQELHPGGKVRKSEYITCNSLRGDARPSLHINLVTGKANDVANPDYHYGDLVAVAADVWGVNQYQAARQILQRFGYGQAGDAGNMDPEHQAQIGRMKEKAARKRRQEERQKQAREDFVRRTIAPQLWHGAEPEGARLNAPHPYLAKKRIEGHNARRIRARYVSGYDLLIPICDGGVLMNLQIINPHGKKRFIRGGRVSGCYAPLGSLGQAGTLFICEGWATGATLLECYGGAVACAMFAANLEPVACKLRDRYGPDQHIVIAGDDDRSKKDNAGRKAATKAAEAIGADLIFPEFPAGAPAELSDFNDLHVYQLQQAQGQGVRHG